MIELLCLVMGLQWLCEVVVDCFALPIPPGVLGLVLLLMLIQIKPTVHSRFAAHSEVLLKHFSLFFIPAGTGVLLYIDLIQEYWLVFALIVSLSTVMTLLSTAGVLLINKKFEVASV